MTNFQIGALLLIACAIGATLLQRGRGRISTRVASGWIALWGAAAIAIARPEVTRIVANALGIARGADLVFYLAILGMFIAFFLVHLRLRRFESELTRIVRELALRSPREPGGDS